MIGPFKPNYDCLFHCTIAGAHHLPLQTLLDMFCTVAQDMLIILHQLVLLQKVKVHRLTLVVTLTNLNSLLTASRILLNT